MKAFSNSFMVLLALSAGAMLANAQSGVDAYFGVGTMSADSSAQSIDTFGTGQAFPANTPGLFNTPRLGGAFGKAGAEFMLTSHFGVGGEADFRFAQGAYAGLNYRPLFYRFGEH